MAGLLSMLKKPKAATSMAPVSEEEAAPDDESGGSEKELARLAVQAIKAGDEDAAVDALIEAIRACVNKEDAGEYPPAA